MKMFGTFMKKSFQMFGKMSSDTFSGKAAKVISYEDMAKYYSKPTTAIGRPGPEGHFVARYSQLMKRIRKCGGDFSMVETALGFQSGYLKKGGVVLSLDKLSTDERRKTTSKAPGANIHFIHGGKTSGGISEALQSPTPRDGGVFMPSSGEGLVDYSTVRMMDLSHVHKRSRLANWLSMSHFHDVDESRPRTPLEKRKKSSGSG